MKVLLFWCYKQGNCGSNTEKHAQDHHIGPNNDAIQSTSDYHAHSFFFFFLRGAVFIDIGSLWLPHGKVGS